MSKIRIQNEKGVDGVIIDMATGRVDLHNEDEVGPLAKTWWAAVATSYSAMHQKHGRSFKDLILKAPGVGGEDDGDIIFQPGKGAKGGKGGKGGDVTIVAEKPKELCPECRGNPQGVLMLDRYHPCKTCGGKAQ